MPVGLPSLVLHDAGGRGPPGKGGPEGKRVLRLCIDRQDAADARLKHPAGRGRRSERRPAQMVGQNESVTPPCQAT
jgi:hypothetical protein